MTELTHVELEWVKGRVESWIRVGRNIGCDGGRSCARDSHHAPKPAPRFVWNASESVPKGLYGVQPARRIIVTELVVVFPPEPLATFLADGVFFHAACRSSNAFWHCRRRSSVAAISR